MQYKKLGTSDLSVSSICLGTMTFGNQNTEADAHEQIDYALSRGVNFIDTAEIYPIPPEKNLQGDTEMFVGTWLEKSGRRGDIVLATKVASKNQADVFKTRDASLGLTRDSIMTALDGSLSRLKTDYIDLYQVHVPDRSTNNFGKRAYVHEPERDGAQIEETLEALHELVKSGKVRYIGISNETPWGVMEYLRLSREKGLSRIVSIQNQYTLISRSFEIGLSEMAIRERIGLLAYSPLSMGVLTGKYLGGSRPDGARFTRFERSRARYNSDLVQPAVEAYVSLAHQYGLDPAQAALAFVLSRPFTTSAIIGATSMDQLKVNIAAADTVLSQEVLQAIEGIYAGYPDPMV